MSGASRSALMLATASLVLAAGCGRGSSPAVAPITDATSTSAPVEMPTTSTSVEPADAPFRSSVRTIDGPTAARMKASWRPGCPVPLEDLRLVTVPQWGFDGRARDGELVVHQRYAEAIAGVFEKLFTARFPIEQVRLVDEFGGDDDLSMAANNTSAFNCRKATGAARWSEHAFGRAVDLNPVQNPYVTRSGSVLPPNGAAFVTRDEKTPGLITRGGPVVAAFRAIGWGWGGDWAAGKDYQHFSATGR